MSITTSPGTCFHINNKAYYLQSYTGMQPRKSQKGFFISQARFFTQQNLKLTSCLCFPEQFELVVSSFSASEIDQQPTLSNDFLIVCLITEWTQPDHDKQSMDQTGIMQMSSLHLNPVISGEGKGTRPRGGAHLFYLDGNVPPGWATQIYKQDGDRRSYYFHTLI